MPLDEHLRLQELSDREVLLVLRDMADPDGYADADEIASALSLSVKHGLRIVTSRLVWLKRWGALEREPLESIPKVPGEPRRRPRWRMTPAGEALALGDMRKRTERALSEAQDTDLLGITRLLAERQRSGTTTVAQLVKREWRYHTEYAARRNGR